MGERLVRLIVIILFFLNCLTAQTFNVSVDKKYPKRGRYSAAND